MKIPNSVAAVYREIYPEYLNLQREVDRLLRADKRDSWHYFSRLKKDQSYALKLETGRVSDIKRPEDFFACTLVVENLNEISNAIAIIEKKFTVQYRRPFVDSQTHKESSAFPFDDLRLYLKITTVDFLPSNPINELIFEMQIKTFLQHAWGIATHDLIYKSDKISWSRERVAYQIKAMLEQAEVSISGVEQLARLPELAKENKGVNLLNNMVDFIKTTFSTEALPNDLLRLSRILNDILIYFKVSLDDLQQFLTNETAAGRGTRTLDLSPYAVIIQSIINQRPDAFEAFFKASYRHKKHSVFVPAELSIEHLKIEEPKRLIRS